MKTGIVGACLDVRRVQLAGLQVHGRCQALLHGRQVPVPEPATQCSASNTQRPALNVALWLESDGRRGPAGRQACKFRPCSPSSCRHLAMLTKPQISCLHAQLWSAKQSHHPATPCVQFSAVNRFPSEDTSKLGWTRLCMYDETAPPLPELAGASGGPAQLLAWAPPA